jgi:replicative DNA helicase
LTSATEHTTTLLAAIIPDRRDLLDRALRYLTPEHFPEQTMRNIFVMLERYGEVTGAIMTRAALSDMLAGARADAGKVALYEETYDLLYATQANEADFRWALEQIRELAAERATGAALTQAMEILTRGAEGEHGENLRGHADSRTHALQRFAQIDRDLTMQESPEGDMRAEGEDILADYALRKQAAAAGRMVGIEFGIPELDNKMNGLNNGELHLLVGFTGEGKTSLVVQLAWNAAIKQGRNVVILTTETLRTQVRRRLVARHSCLEHFNIPKGLNSRDIKMGLLNPDQERQLSEVVTDFTHNPGYGHVYIVQVPRGATMGYCESKLTRIQRMFNIDLAIMDYFALLKPERRRPDDRQELGSILKDGKQLAVTFNDGAGFPFVTPWQVSRSARQEAERTGYYTASALSETAEASNSADGIISLLAPLDNDQRYAKVKMQVMKNRDGEKANAIEVQVDYATGWFSAVGRPQSMDELFTGDPLAGL